MGDDQQHAPANDTLHEQSDANGDLSMGYAVRTGICHDPHKSGRQDGY